MSIKILYILKTNSWLRLCSYRQNCLSLAYK